MNDILFQPLGNPIAAGTSLEHIADIDPRMTRTHYFDGRLLTAEDLERDQIYLDQRLREIGKVLGHGVINGLELGFNRFNGLLTLEPGQAMTALGRVLQLNSQLMVSLGDRSLIAQLNNSKYRQFNRALYAVVLRYVEVATDVAEVFPTDLGSKRGADYAKVTEAVQMGLVPLPVPLPQQDALHIRASLMREFLGNKLADTLIPEDSVALGVIAIQNDTPQWLDSQLLRQPLRTEPGGTGMQEDLSRQYEALFADIFNQRGSREFAASEFFSLLPPVGTMPRAAINAEKGYQGYFPENFNVHIAPIRLSDMELVRTESLNLPNIDLNSGERADIVVLAPLSNQEYALYAPQLEREYNADNRRLPQLDLLRLKLYPTHPVHTLDTDANVWQAIWSAIADRQLMYVRRPVRAAETSISSIVLALGSAIPAQLPPIEGRPDPEEPGTRPVPDRPVIDSPVIGRPILGQPVIENPRVTGTLQPAVLGRDSIALDPSVFRSLSDGGRVIEDEDSVFLRFINIPRLAEIRPAEDATGEKAMEKLASDFGKDMKTVQQANEFLLRVERRFDALVWPTLLVLAQKEALPKMLEVLKEAKPDPQATGEAVLKLGADAGMTETLQKRWKKLLEEPR